MHRSQLAAQPVAQRGPVSAACRGHFGPVRGRQWRRRKDVVCALPLSTMTVAEQATYIGLGLTAVSFIGTFVVVPAFKDRFKEPIDWKDMYRDLAQAGVKTITPEEAYAKSKRGAVLVDVRLPAKHAEQHPAGSLGVPLYLPIQKWDVPSVIRRLGFAFFGIYGTELNPAFSDQVLLRVPRSKEVMLICEAGGSIQNKSGTQFGFQSRSLKALYYLRQAGYTKLLHVSGGTAQWNRDELPVEEEGEDGTAAAAAAEALATASRGAKAGNGSSSSSSKSSSSSSGLRLAELLRLPVGVGKTK